MGQIWFIVNLFFVISFIVLLFNHRAVLDAKLNGADSSRLIKLKKRRNTLIILTVALFIAMAGSFMVHMRING
ncbi:hypothetical protein [Paenibacillus abyssi]|uniref:Uncharacterized protein n=1 Tax=Paenibacillus abyssi TaxID=1340531 RepID=A0A917CIG9_9BACL|nr:hypothetical protein [Paenibacillus abyssi]GGF86861.1 hypothetical protein GCM10010916_00240 [Paenibacillus abyssi]